MQPKSISLALVSLLDFATLVLTLQGPERRGFSVGTKLIELVQRATRGCAAITRPSNHPIALWPDIFWRRKKKERVSQ